jgi:hypothetical protein
VINLKVSRASRLTIPESFLVCADCRVDNINFSLREGAVVPGSVRVREVPEALVEIYPQECSRNAIRAISAAWARLGLQLTLG